MLHAEHLDRAEDPDAAARLPRGRPIASRRLPLRAGAAPGRAGPGAGGRAGRPVRLEMPARATSCTTSAPCRPPPVPTRARWTRRRATPSAAGPGSGSLRSSGSPTTWTGRSPTWSRPRAAAVAQGLIAEQARSPLSCAAISSSRAATSRAACASTAGAWSWRAQAGSAELEAAALGGLGDAEYMRGRMISAHDGLQTLRRAGPAAGSRSHRGRQLADGGPHAVVHGRLGGGAGRCARGRSPRRRRSATSGRR